MLAYHLLTLLLVAVANTAPTSPFDAAAQRLSDRSTQQQSDPAMTLIRREVRNYYLNGAGSIEANPSPASSTSIFPCHRIAVIPRA